MKYIYKFIAILLCVRIFAIGEIMGSTQKNPPVAPLTIEELPKRPVDTIETNDPETKVIIYTNNTWEFYRPEIAERLSNNDAYKFNWDTLTIFSYRNVNLDDLPEVTDLELYNEHIKFTSPIKGRVLSKFGLRGRSPHNGVDIPLKTGEPIVSAFDGKVRYAKYNTGGYGYLVIIRHPNGLETWYAHFSRINVLPNDFVKAGQIIGYGGSTGRSSGPHLHFETRYKDQAFDPERIFDFEKGLINIQQFALEKRFLNIRSRASEVLDETHVSPTNAGGSLIANTDPQRWTNATQPRIPTVYHTVKSGDTLGHIAQKYKVSVDQICRLNGIKRTTTLKLGRKLRIK